MNRPRIAVVGLGAIGSMTSWNLARRGAQVTAFERFSVGHDAGAYGGRTRQFRIATHDQHNEIHIPLARRARELWHELERERNCQLLLATGQLAVGPASDPDIVLLQTNVKAAGIHHELLTPAEVSARFPVHALGPQEVGLFVAEAGVLRSNRSVLAAVELAVQLGAEILESSPVTRVESVAGGARVTAAGQEHRFDHVIITAGPWVAQLVPGMAGRVTARQIVTTWHPAKLRGAGDPDRLPLGFRRSDPHEHEYTFLPSVDGDGVKIVYWIPTRPEVTDTTTAGEPIDPAVIDATAQALTVTMPGVRARPSAAALYLEGFTANRFPIIYSADASVTVAAGFSGLGFAISPAVGQTIADIALGEIPSFDIQSAGPEAAAGSPPGVTGSACPVG